MRCLRQRVTPVPGQLQYPGYATDALHAVLWVRLICMVAVVQFKYSNRVTR